MKSPFSTIVTDVDGVLNTGRFLYNDGGKKFKEFGAHDADGVKLLRKLGINVVAISADKRGWDITKKRMDDMHIDLHLVTEAERFNWLKDRFSQDDTMFVGDGLWDCPALNYFEYSVAPANACNLALAAAKYRSDINGGDGLFLGIAQLVLSNWFKAEYEELLRELGFPEEIIDASVKESCLP